MNGRIDNYIYARGETPSFSYFLMGDLNNEPTALGIQRLIAHAGPRTAWLLGIVLVLSATAVVAWLRRKQ
jgi:hypothetical protein